MPSPGTRHQSRNRLLVVVSLLSSVLTSVSGLRFSYGLESGDSEVTGDASSLSPLPRGQTLAYYGLTLNAVRVYKDAYLTFAATPLDLFSLEQGSMSSLRLPVICAFCAHIRVQDDGIEGLLGQAYFRVTRYSTVLDSLSDLAGEHTSFSPLFRPTVAVVATWVDVRNQVFLAEDPKTNTFQMVLASDGQETMVTAEYDVIGWVFDGNPSWYDAYDDVSELNIRAQVSFYKGDGSSMFQLPASFSADMLSLTADSTGLTPGLYVFRVDGTPTNASLPSSTTTTTATSATAATAKAEEEGSSDTETRSTTTDTHSTSLAVGVSVTVTVLLLLSSLLICLCWRKNKNRRERRAARGRALPVVSPTPYYGNTCPPLSHTLKLPRPHTGRINDVITVAEVRKY